MSDNKSLHAAAKAKFDEFYTRIEDIENECGNYTELFEGKVIFCNCDDPYESNFFKYFAMNFNAFKLKKLLASSYAGSSITQTGLAFADTPNEIADFDNQKDALKAVMTEFKDWNGDEREDLFDVRYFLQNHNGAITKLSGDTNYPAGDFRSKECIEMLKQADIVVTNPPFSLFREYVALLMKYNKKFLILGNKAGITYAEILPLFMQNKLWIGYTPMSKDILFTVPKDAEDNLVKKSAKGSKYRIVDGEIFARSPVVWYTNLDVRKRHQKLPLGFSYHETPEKYPKYDNYDAIEVSRTVEIPKDYYGVMGVPISFLDKYNPDQFEILGMTTGRDEFGAHPIKRYVNAVQHNPDGSITNGTKTNTGATIRLDNKPAEIYYTADNVEGFLKVVYARILIRRKIAN